MQSTGYRGHTHNIDSALSCLHSLPPEPVWPQDSSVLQYFYSFSFQLWTELIQLFYPILDTIFEQNVEKEEAFSTRNRVEKGEWLCLYEYSQVSRRLSFITRGMVEVVRLQALRQPHCCCWSSVNLSKQTGRTSVEHEYVRQRQQQVSNVTTSRYLYRF